LYSYWLCCESETNDKCALSAFKPRTAMVDGQAEVSLSVDGMSRDELETGLEKNAARCVERHHDAFHDHFKIKTFGHKTASPKDGQRCRAHNFRNLKATTSLKILAIMKLYIVAFALLTGANAALTAKDLSSLRTRRATEHCWPCSVDVCDSYINACSDSSPFVCLEGKAQSGCTANESLWLNPVDCTSCCDLTNCPTPEPAFSATSSGGKGKGKGGSMSRRRRRA